ncbi:serine aminopeptidase domain-containing protein [Caldimonas tepidiphila]|uniref:serine aminopeptidase domain-containing protein n=1 Tax=Caldimonas tepidiphila TaxID=2315841 RepID=UPI000E5A6C35|nr:alpha/beta hydrolase [Caldimonas tepidiphila]
MNEQTVIFGPQQHLVGTLTFSDGVPGLPPGEPPPIVAVLTNAGVIPRVGPHRMNVRLARWLAGLGIPSIRFDLSGLGDSARPDTTLPAMEQFVADTRAAMDLAAAQFGCNRFLMLGFCSGGDIAQLVATEDERLRAIMLYDSYVYPTRLAKLRGLVHRTRRHGLVSTAQRLSRYLKRTRAAGGGADGTGTPMIFGRTRMPPRDEFGQRIRTLTERGVEVYFVYSGGEPDFYNHRRQFREMYEPYGFVGRVAYDYLPQADHTLTQPHAQQALAALVQRWVLGRVLVKAASAPPEVPRPQPRKAAVLPGPEAAAPRPVTLPALAAAEQEA